MLKFFLMGIHYKFWNSWKKIICLPIFLETINRRPPRGYLSPGWFWIGPLDYWTLDHSGCGLCWALDHSGLQQWPCSHWSQHQSLSWLIIVQVDTDILNTLGLVLEVWGPSLRYQWFGPDVPLLLTVAVSADVMQLRSWLHDTRYGTILCWLCLVTGWFSDMNKWKLGDRMSLFDDTTTYRDWQM